MKGPKAAAPVFLLLLAISVCLACGNNANHAPKVAAEESAAINLSAITGSNQTQTFSEVKRVSSLPKAVLDQLGRIADRGQPFNTTDVVDPKLPMRQLTVAAVSKQYCIVGYWHGGIVLAFTTAIFELSDGNAKLIWLSYSQGGFNFRDLKAMVESGRMHNDLDKNGL